LIEHFYSAHINSFECSWRLADVLACSQKVSHPEMRLVSVAISASFHSLFNLSVQIITHSERVVYSIHYHAVTVSCQRDVGLTSQLLEESKEGDNLAPLSFPLRAKSQRAEEQKAEQPRIDTHRGAFRLGCDAAEVAAMFPQCLHVTRRVLPLAD
jgi:hypothetical protein